MKNTDRWNKNSFPYQKNIQQYFPLAPETTLLWLQFIGKTVWQPGAMVYHPQTIYLDLEIVDEGEMFVQYGGEKIYVPAGSAILIPPGESKLSAGSRMKCRKRFLGIAGPVLNNNMERLNLSKATVLGNFPDTEFDGIYEKLFAFFEAKDNKSVRPCCALIYQLLLLLSECAGQCSFPPELQRAVNFITTNFSRQLDLEDICHAAKCRKTKLQWLFKHHLDSSPIRYLIATRMDYAVKLLQNTEYSIKEIADRCGYLDPLYFSNTFLKYRKCSPRAYRRQIMSRSVDSF